MAFSATFIFAGNAVALGQIKTMGNSTLDGVADRLVVLAKSKAHVLTGKNRASIHKDGQGNERIIATQSGYGGIEELRGGDHAYMRPSLFQVQSEIASGRTFT